MKKSVFICFVFILISCYSYSQHGLTVFYNFNRMDLKVPNKATDTTKDSHMLSITKLTNLPPVITISTLDSDGVINSRLLGFYVTETDQSTADSGRKRIEIYHGHISFGKDKSEYDAICLMSFHPITNKLEGVNINVKASDGILELGLFDFVNYPGMAIHEEER